MSSQHSTMSLELPSSSVILLSGQCHLHHHRSCGCPCLLSACRGKYPIAGTRIDLFALFQFPSFLPTNPQFNFHVAPEGKQQLGFLERQRIQDDGSPTRSTWDQLRYDMKFHLLPFGGGQFGACLWRAIQRHVLFGIWWMKTETLRSLD